MSKPARLLALAKLRQATRWPNYTSIGDYHGGIYECDLVSPFTKAAGIVDSEIMVLLQDWSSEKNELARSVQRVSKSPSREDPGV